MKRKEIESLDELEDALVASVLGDHWTRNSLRHRLGLKIDDLTMQDIPPEQRTDRFSAMLMEWSCEEHAAAHEDRVLGLADKSLERMAISGIIHQVASGAISECLQGIVLLTISKDAKGGKQ